MTCNNQKTGGIPDFGKVKINSDLKPSTYAILHNNHGREYLSLDNNLALKHYGTSIMYLSHPDAEISPISAMLENRAYQGLVAALIAIKPTGDLVFLRRLVDDAREQINEFAAPFRIAAVLNHLLSQYLAVSDSETTAGEDDGE